LQERQCANVMITNDHCLQSPVRVPCYYRRLKIYRVFNVMSDTVVSCTNIPLETPLARLVTADPSIGVIERDYSARMNGLSRERRLIENVAGQS
jgi:hypothetical protein